MKRAGDFLKDCVAAGEGLQGNWTFETGYSFGGGSVPNVLQKLSGLMELKRPDPEANNYTGEFGKRAPWGERGIRIVYEQQGRVTASSYVL
jgi:hypothetical protein